MQNISLPRRTLLTAGGMGLLGLTMPKLLRAAEGPQAITRPAKAKRVIFLFQWGGPSHVDTIDMKPNASDKIRGPFKPIQSSLPGVPICEHFPKLAKIMHKVTVVRSMTHTMNNHNSAGYYALTGHSPIIDDQRLRESPDLFPGYGCVVDKLAPLRGPLPTHVAYPHAISDGSKTPGQQASFLGKQHDPLFFQDDPNKLKFKLPELSLPDNISPDRLARRRGLQQLIDKQTKLMEQSAEVRGFDQHYEQAIGILTAPEVRKAFDLSAEPEKVRDAYGRTTYGQSCLLARRLVESGVKFVTVYFARSIGGKSTTDGGWDTHGFDNTRMFPIVEKYHHPLTDQTLPTLINDLDERGLLDETLVLWMGEFGRTPKINNNVSRDHWPKCYSALLAGGGVKRGFIYGKSDDNGMAVDEHPVRPEDLSATLFHMLGIDPGTEVHDRNNRPLAISSGHPVTGILG